MNNINFLGRSSFPWSSDTFDFSQGMLLLAAQIAKLGGDTYILDGCVQTGMDVANGYVVIKGELLPFVGGTKQDTVYIKETKRSVNASGYHYPDVYTTRIVEFGLDANSIKWDDIKRVETNTQLSEAISNLKKEIESLQGIPKGIITMWSGDPANVPLGWALCDGLDSRPNLMGRFIVGYNQSDSDYDQIGKTGGAKTVTLTKDQMPKHSHIIGTRQEGESKKGNGARDASVGNFTDDNPWGTKTTNEVGGGLAHENRPPYYVLAYIIKL